MTFSPWICRLALKFFHCVCASKFAFKRLDIIWILTSSFSDLLSHGILSVPE